MFTTCPRRTRIRTFIVKTGNWSEWSYACGREWLCSFVSLFDYHESGHSLVMKAVGAIVLLMCAGAVCGSAADVRSPVLVELFTSEGCSSCPPVDALVQKLDASQPLPGVQLVVLSEHVDYWNHDGWKDPYSSTLATSRQEAYEDTLKVDEPYTPQIIVNGKTVVRSYDPHRLAEIFEKAAVTPKVTVKITSLNVDGSVSPVIRAHIEVNSDSTSSGGDVYLAIALDHAESQVSAGENNGKRLTHVAVMQSLKKLGKLENGKAFTEDCRIKLKKGDEPNNLRVIAFVQEPGLGQVLGAAMRSSVNLSKSD